MQEKYSSVINISPIQCKMARTALNIGVRDLAKLADVAQLTVSRFERGDELKSATIEKIQAALELAGIVFVPENGHGVGVRLKKGSKNDR